MKTNSTINQKYQNSHITPKELHRIWWQLHELLESNPNLWLASTSLKKFAPCSIPTKSIFLKRSIKLQAFLSTR